MEAGWEMLRAWFVALDGWAVVLLCLAALVPVTAILSLCARRRARRRRTQPEKEPDPIEMERRVLRLMRHVRPLSGPEEAFGLERLPDGIYGFIQEPFCFGSPVLRIDQADLFEVHKVAGGTTLLVGFISREEAARLETATGRCNLTLSSKPRVEAPALVNIPMPYVMRFKQHYTRDENVIELVVEPLHRWAAEFAPAPRIPADRVGSPTRFRSDIRAG